MAPCVVSAHAVATALGAGDYHTARYQWSVDGPIGWTSPTCLDPRLGLQEGDTISLDTDCEGFNFAFPADVAGNYTLHLTVTDEDGSVYTAQETITVAADTRTALYVSASGNDTTGDGSIGNPWRQPSKAWTHVRTNGKADFSILIEKAGTYTGFDNDNGAHGDCDNIRIASYGSGAAPILKWSTAAYASGKNLLSLTGCENVYIQDLNFRGNDADGINDDNAIVLGSECLNIGFVGLTFGGAADADRLAFCVLSNATNTRTAVPAYQGRGYVLVNCSGHSTKYFLFLDANDTEGTVSDAGFANTATEFECSPTRLSTTDDIYNGMEITVAGGAGRNQRRTVLDYVGNTGSGKAKFTLATALSGVPTSGELVLVASIIDVGDSDVFIFGCSNRATGSYGVEVRARFINSTRVTAVGSVMDGSTNALQPKSGWRLMVDFCYLYRCAELNGGVQIGVDLGAGGCGPHTYMVMDRCYFACLDADNKSPFGFTYCAKTVVKACVAKGNLTPGQETNSLTTFSSEYNTGGSDVRILHCSLFMNVWSDGVAVAQGQGLAVGRTYWPAAFLTYENNLQIHGATLHYTDFLRDPHLREGGASSTSILSAVGNVFVPDETAYGGGLAFSVPGEDLTLAQLNAKDYADGNAYGTMTADDLIAADYVPTGTPETTTRTTTSKGVFQDYYGRSPVGFAYAGAVGKAI